MIVYVVTPCLNMAATIDRTIQSVVSQAGDFELVYVVQDGGSVDGTLEKLARWQRRIENGTVVPACRALRFRYVSAPDRSMYDGLARGVSETGAGKSDFLTWINGDDILMPGALAIAAEMARQFKPEQVSWFGGAVAVMRDDLPLRTFVRKLPTEAVRAGLCDGVHWDFVQQEGTFFRRWLWDAVEPDRTIAPMRLAGDWNLWRLFAQRASLVQTAWPLGCFRVRSGQLSGAQRDAYTEEIETLVPSRARRAALAELAGNGGVSWRRLKIDYATGAFTLTDESASDLARERYSRVFTKAPAGAAARTDAARPAAPPEGLVVRPGLVALDAHWQYPAITERHAFEQLRTRLPANAVESGGTYVGYPWATLIDKLNVSTKDAAEHLALFRQFCAHLPAGGVRLTVCQHILLPRFLHLFAEAGIQEVFWSHATHRDVSSSDNCGIQVHPFPLFPVQVPEALPSADPAADPVDGAGREHLFCFAGARPTAWYLSQVRSWIIDRLSDHPRGQIIGRDQWHYQKVVYDFQVRGSSSTSDGLVDSTAAGMFRDMLQNSIFALCPSGSGPNSIRLWEAMGVGAIPVILSDNWAPPGNRKLWENAVVFCREAPDAVSELPDRLEAIAAEPGRLPAMRQALRQLWLLYGPQGFTYDVEKRIAALAGSASGWDMADAAEGAARHLLMWAGRALATPPDRAIAPMPERVVTARAALPAAHPSVVQFDRALTVAATLRPEEDLPKVTPAAPETPALNPVRPLAIHLFGRHGNRTPFSYEPLRRIAGNRVALVDDPTEADILMTGFSIDLHENAGMLRAVTGRPGAPKVVVLSEEPLWDTVWSGGFSERQREMDCGGLKVPYVTLNHVTSDIYNFNHIPYFLLTSEDFAPRYAALIRQQATRSPRELLDHWASAPVSAAFFAERRDDPRYAPDISDPGIQCLSIYRSEVAQTVAETLPAGRVLCTGKGWGSVRPRQQLADWHLDKIAILHGRVKIVAAYENTHHKHYISEKVFDAFAVGGIPAYVAAPNHRIHDLVAEGAMLNDLGLPSAEAAARIAAFSPDIATAEAWCETAHGLAALFARHDLLAEERRRVMAACLDELTQIAQEDVDLPPIAAAVGDL